MTLAGPRLTAIGSGKGGTGKTFITLTLAQAFADQGEHVLVCDADLGLSNTAVQLGLAHGGDLPGFIAGRTTLQRAVTRVQTAGHAAFDLLAAPAGSGALWDADGSTAQRLVAVLRQAGQYERVLIDLGAGIGDMVMTLAAEADDVLVVVTPDPASLTDAYAFIKLAIRRTGGRVPAILVNMAAGAPEAKRTADALTNSARTFLKASPAYLGFVPNDMRAVECLRRQVSLWVAYPKSPSLTAIATVTGMLGSQSRLIQQAGSLR